VAASLTTLGKRCAIVMQEDLTLERHFGPTAGRWVHELLEAHGVEVHGGEVVARFAGDGRVERVVCASGLELEAGAVVLGVGAMPDVMLARSAGLELGETGGVRCDAALRTSAEAVWAAGDVCEYDSVLHGRRLRIEHWDVAVEQGRTAARGMLGSEEPHRAVPYFFSDLGDWASLEYVGPAVAWDEEEVRGSTDDGEFSVLYRQDGRIVAALAVGGRAEDLDEARAAIAAGP
jgi:3-phenylpropionate/trans-cinnamate dioxygenase ferredoxin reductase subunit